MRGIAQRVNLAPLIERGKSHAPGPIKTSRCLDSAFLGPITGPSTALDSRRFSLLGEQLDCARDDYVVFGAPPDPAL